MTPRFAVRSTPHFERLARRLTTQHPEFPRLLAQAIEILESRQRCCRYPNSFVSACVFSSQNRMSISWYIVVAVVRCSWASSRLSVRR